MNKLFYLFLFTFIMFTINSMGSYINTNKIIIDSIFFQTISTKDNLPNSIIYNIEQDSLGFLWLSSDDGLFRYDGKNFKIFRSTPKDPKSLTYNSFSDMHLDNNGNPWILYPGGLDRLDTNTGEIKHYKQEPTTNKNMFMYDANKFVITPENNIFITGWRNGLFFLNQNDSLIKTLNSEKQNFPILNESLSSISYNENCLYIGKHYDGVYKVYLNKDNSEILNVKKIISSVKARIHTILPDYGNNLWIGTSNGIIYHNQISDETTRFFSKNKNNHFLPKSEILSLHIDESYNLWIGTREDGLSIVSINDLKAKGDLAKGIKYLSDNKKGSLSNRCINKIFKDMDGNIWLGTFSGGIQIAANFNNKIHSLDYIPGHPKSISHPKVWGITEDYKGNIWIGTDGGGIDIWNPQHGIINRLNTNNGLSDNAILCAMTDFNDNLWFGTYRGGINKINPKTGQIKIYKRIPTPNKKYFTSDVRIIYQSKYGRIWIGTNLNGLCYYDDSKDKIINVSELRFIDVRSIIEMDNGDLWIGTHGNGLIYYNFKSKQKKNYTLNNSFNNSIPSNNINYLLSDDSSKIWIGTEFGGLSCFNTKNESFENYDIRDGLSSNTVLSILEDTNGYLWLSTNDGLSRFDRNKKSFINYDMENGVLHGEFLNSSCIKASNGMFYFGNSSGLNFFNPSYIQPSIDKPKVVFTNLKVFNENILPGNGIIDKNIEFNPIINLNHKQSVITLEFQAIQYPLASKCKYSFKLEGYDKKWNMAGNNNSATYRQLPSGTYSFKVKATNSDGLWSDKVSLIQIKVNPPFWLTLEAYFIYAIILLTVTILVSKFRMNLIKTINQLQYEKKIRQEEHKIHQERLIFFTNISHELRTPLTMVECAIDELKMLLKNSHTPKVKELIKTAGFHSSRLLELVNQLLEFRRVEMGTPQIVVENININDWLSTYIANFKEMADSKSVNLKLSIPVNTTMLYGDKDKLSMIMNNLISNAFKYTPKKGTIQVNTEDKDDVIIIEITNTGEGISKKALPNIFERYYKTDSNTTSTGIGLSLTKSLVELHKGSIEVSTIPGKQTKFTLTFLKGNSHFTPDQINITEHPKTDESDIISEERKSNLIRNEDSQVMLIIEDNEDISSMLASRFSSNFEVKVAENGEEGIELAKKIIPNIIISDIMMPGIQGTEVCSILKNSPSTSHIPLILLTAKGTIEDELSGLTTGADDYISKPFNFKILEARVNTLIKNRISLLSYFSEIKTAKPTPEISKAELLEQEFLENTEQLIINKYLTPDSSVVDLARDLNFSRSSLYRKIKMLTGKSINEFIRSVKIKKAAQLLEESDITVSEAAFSVGFNDLKYFRENFVQQIGETPSAYKKNAKTNRKAI